MVSEQLKTQTNETTVYQGKGIYSNHYLVIMYHLITKHMEEDKQ